MAQFLRSFAKVWKEADQETENRLARELLDEIWVQNELVVAKPERAGAILPAITEGALKKSEDDSSTSLRLALTGNLGLLRP